MTQKLEKPSKEELERMYIGERMSANKIGREFGVCYTTVLKWLKGYGIGRESWKSLNFTLQKSREFLEENSKYGTLPSDKILQKLGYSGLAAGIHRYHGGIFEFRQILNQHLGINLDRYKREKQGNWKSLEFTLEKVKEFLEEHPKYDELPNSDILKELNYGNLVAGIERYHGGFIKFRPILNQRTGIKPQIKMDKPSKERLEQMYIQKRMSANKIGKEIRKSTSTIFYWLREYSIPIRGKKRGSKGEFSNESFISFLEKDETARNLAALAVSLGEEGYDVEEVIIKASNGKFKDLDDLHKLLQDNADKILSLVEQGFANLGKYIGEFSINDRDMLPILLNEALMKFPKIEISYNLEERLIGVLRTIYGPRFNTNPRETISEIRDKKESLDGKAKILYETLENHYQETLDLMGELYV